jgi:hypothetical protein
LKSNDGRKVPTPTELRSSDGKAEGLRVFPIRGLRRWKDTTHKGARRHGRLSRGVTLLLKATLPTCVPSRRGLSILQHAPRSSPNGAGAGSHASCKLAQGRRSQTTARGACNRPAVTSTPPLSPRPADERAGSHAGGMQLRQVGAPLRLPTRPAWGPRPTRHATGVPVATCEQLHRHSHHYRASSTAEPVP